MLPPCLSVAEMDASSGGEVWIGEWGGVMYSLDRTRGCL